MSGLVVKRLIFTISWRPTSSSELEGVAFSGGEYHDSRSLCCIYGQGSYWGKDYSSHY